MFIYKQLSIFVFGIALFMYSVPETKAQETEIEKLIKEVSVDTQKGAIFGYTYFMKFSYHRHKKFGSGRKFTRLYEAILPARFSLKKNYTHPFVLIRDSERAITGEDIDSMRNRLVSELERAESEADAHSSEENERKDGGYWTISFSANGRGVRIDVLKLLENSLIFDLQRGQIEGRNVISLRFSPKTGATWEKSLSYLGKIEGQIWIDDADKRIIRIEGFPLGRFEENKGIPDDERERQAVFLMVQTRVAEGFWFPKHVVADFTKNSEIFDTVRIEFSFTDYKKSSVEVQSTEIKPPPEAEEAGEN